MFTSSDAETLTGVETACFCRLGFGFVIGGGVGRMTRGLFRSRDDTGGVGGLGLHGDGAGDDLGSVQLSNINIRSISY